jgi:Flp pilus assembly protein TadD
MAIAQGAVGPNGGLPAVEAHYAALSARLGYAVPVPETVLNLAGYQALQEGDGPAALRAFRRNAELHPASPNVHDSLGEALEREGDLPGARLAYMRAWELGEPAKDPNTAVYKANLARVTAALGTRPVGLSR